MRQNSATRVYPVIIRAPDRAGLCAWSLESGKLPQSADESVKVRTEATAQGAIYLKGDALKQGLKSYCQNSALCIQFFFSFDSPFVLCTAKEFIECRRKFGNVEGYRQPPPESEDYLQLVGDHMLSLFR